jgi:pyruvate dehydrogenase E1 component alpha subunit
MELPAEKLKDLYVKMMRIRSFEEKLVELTTLKGYYLGTLHLYCGQEAVGVGVCSNLNDDDYITIGHRAHGQSIAKGANINAMMAELFGKKTGSQKGKSGSMHMCERKVGNIGGNGIVGANIPIATGAALSAKLRGTDQVAVSFFGEGASNQGVFHESLNMASLWKLPVIYVCENNQYAVSTPVTQSTSVKNISTRAKAYNMIGETIDGMDVIAVYKAAKEAVERARKGLGPTLLECETYRYYGHMGGWVIEPFWVKEYRTKVEVDEWRARDPIDQLKAKLIRDKLLTEKQIEALDASIIKEIDDAVEFAENSPSPAPEDALKDIYAE